ncbi:MAG: integrase core domain-containing protein [Polyangiaceae bacterium]
MSLKMEFVERAAKGESVASLCREFKVSRQSGHKWIKRFKEQGYAGLEEESRRPKSAPLATAEDLVIATIQAREAHPRWGPIKLQELLRRRFGDQTPGTRTIARILKRANKVRERRKRSPVSVIEQAPGLVAVAPNDVWTIDFKGWWRTTNGDRCEPLTVRDAASRFVLAIELGSTTTQFVRGVLEPLFRRHGLPKVIQCDNGSPFISVKARAGLSQLSASWVAMGIRVVRSRPGCPQDNGGHERMHADVRADVQARPAANREQQQRELDRWRVDFNQVRPHQALGNKTPAEVYKVTDRRRPPTKPFAYPPHLHVRRVDARGEFRFRNDRCFLGSSFRGLRVGLEVVDAMRVRAWLHELDLGLVDTLPVADDACFDLPVPARNATACKNIVPSRRRGAGSAQSLSSPALL